MNFLTVMKFYKNYKTDNNEVQVVEIIGEMIL